MKPTSAAGGIILTLILLGCILGAGCVSTQTPASQTLQTPAVVPLTGFDDYNLYLVDYTGMDYKFDELMSENITDTAVLKKRIAELAAPGTGVVLNLPTKAACSVFLVNDGGKYLLGRNFDLEDTSSLLVHTKPANGYESLGIAVVNMLNKGAKNDPSNAANALVSPYACMDGVNEKGVAIAVNSVDGPQIKQERGNPAVLPPMIIRLVLDKADSVDSAVKLIESVDARMIMGFQYFIADKTGNTAIINYINNETVVTRGEKLMTNFYLCDIPENYSAGHGQDRYAIAQEVLDAAGYAMNTTKAFELLQLIQQTPESGGLGTTQWSVVYHLNSSKADVVCHRHFEEVASVAFGSNISSFYAAA
ncbi:MAG TPA: carcinine hydrolase/isopenicillin-N N-acyltransferase family protein [Methanocorpusculum sp.]|nr:carcinine hydrolase/isopenicillin-N N-acyltransferase family protein [Methanocorpusculum sp.]